MRILVTGASGLLGSRMMNVFGRHWSVAGTCHSQRRPGLIQCDLLDWHTAGELLGRADYDWLIHCAANRNPDTCERSPRNAMSMNAEATGWLARAAADTGCRMLYISTDYVFPGTEPPYSEEDRVQPINVYGHSKLAGEEHAFNVPGGLVVRVPALYSLDLEAPNNLLGALQASLAADETLYVEDEIVRYYTLAEEVAEACRFLIEQEHFGLVHVSAQARTTKYQFLRRAAEVLAGSANSVEQVPAEQRPATRPADSHLDTTHYQSLGGPEMTGWSDALERLRT